jgi:hypothetical protein
MGTVSSESLRTVFICVMVLLPALGTVNAIYHGRLLQHYVRQTKRIRDLDGLAQFQKTVARQMYAALVQLVLFLVPMILYFIGIPSEILRLGDIVFVFVPGGILIALGYHFKKVESEACRIPALGEELDKQRLAVIKTWKTRPLPNW